MMHIHSVALFQAHLAGTVDTCCSRLDEIGVNNAPVKIRPGESLSDSTQIVMATNTAFFANQKESWAKLRKKMGACLMVFVCVGGGG